MYRYRTFKKKVNKTMVYIMLKKMFEVLGNLTVLFGMIPTVRDIVSFHKITVRVYNSIVPKRFSGKFLFKDANDIWVLGENNFDRFEGLLVASCTCKSSTCNFGLHPKTEAVQLWR
jgi:hypothetical protein